MRLRSIILMGLSMLMISCIVCAQEQSDEQILAVLKRRIQPSTGVTVQVQNGNVTLSGTVPFLADAANLQDVARRTLYVRGVTNRITVVPPLKRSDAEIVTAVKSSIAKNLSKEEQSAITVRSASGVVTLAGTLSESYPKQLAMLLTSWVWGVVEVRNQIVVKPAQIRTDAQILSDIKDRFAQNPAIPQSNIEVSVSGGIVTLSGIVESFLQSGQAEYVVRFAPGVVDIRNQLFVR